jgi:hypothetical protein
MESLSVVAFLLSWKNNGEEIMRQTNKKPGLDGRDRDDDGEIRRKNGNTRVDTLREIYGQDFAPDVRGDMQLRTLLDRKGCTSLTEFLNRVPK